MQDWRNWGAQQLSKESNSLGFAWKDNSHAIIYLSMHGSVSGLLLMSWEHDKWI